MLKVALSNTVLQNVTKGCKVVTCELF